MDWIGITCWAVMGLAAALTLWALLWDRARGRMRCRKCAYDMSGGQLVCPECGREHKSERVLTKTRRRWKTAVVGLLLVGLSLHVGHQRHLVCHEGPIGLVPTIALVLLVDIDEYCQYSYGYPSGNLTVVESLEQRIYKMRAMQFSRRLLSKRIAAYWARKDSAIVRSYDVSGILPLSYSSPVMFFSSHRGTNRKHELTGDPRSCWDLYDVLLSHAHELHPEYGIEWVDDIGDQWIVSASQEGHVWLGESLKQIQRNRWSAESSAEMKFADQRSQFVTYHTGLEFEMYTAVPEREAEQWVQVITANVQPLSWVSNGGKAARIVWLQNDKLLVWAKPDQHRQVATFIDANLDFWHGALRRSSPSHPDTHPE